MSNLSVNDVAKDLGIKARTVRNYCRTGYLPALQIIWKGRLRYEIENHIYYNWKQKHFRGLKKGEASKYTSQDKEMSLEGLRAAIEEWLEWNAAGKITGKPVGQRTIEINDYYFQLYLKGLGKYPRKPLISVDNLRMVLGSYKPENFATKRNIYEAVMSITRYLIEIKKFTVEDRESLKKLKPKRFLPAKKTSLTESQLNLMLKAIDEIQCSDYDRITSKALVTFLANTGLRASECCNLKLEDIDLEARRVHVILGKGNKNRIVGINSETYEILLEYLKARTHLSCDSFFVSKLNKPYPPMRLSKKVKHIAERAGLKGISAHSLRRSFVTINAGKGKPLNHLRIACGHSDISTTQSYCMTSVDEVVEAMKGW